MDTNKMREQFETALTRQAAEDGFAKPSLRRNRSNGDYVDPFEQAAWWAWQESREAVVVDISARFDLDRDGGRYYENEGQFVEVEDAIKSIEAQGLKVKP